MAATADTRAITGYANAVVGDTSPANTAQGISQIGTPQSPGSYGAAAGKATSVEEMILQELRTMNALLLVAVRGGVVSDIDLLKFTYTN